MDCCTGHQHGGAATSQGGAGVGRVRWRQAALLLVPSVVGAGLLAVLTAEGAIAANVTIAGNAFKVSADQLDGSGLTQLIAVKKGTGAGRHPVLVTGIRRARLRAMCVSRFVSTPMGPVTLLLRGGKGTTVQATELLLDLTHLNSDAAFQGLALGGDDGPQARHLTLRHLRLRTEAITSGDFAFRGLDITLKAGRHECF